jgi:ferric-dicitrate binding protein FerR (iron transport regulator)
MRSNRSEINDDLLVKYLLGEATETERMDVEAWINAGEANKKHFDHFRLIWEESKKIAGSSTVNVDNAWHRFQQRTQQQATATPKTIPLPARPLNRMRVAAMLVLLLGAGWLIYTLTSNKSGQVISLRSGDSILTDTLPDGSIVTLNKNSTLAYNQKSEDDIRSVKLEGEAFFNVAPDKTHPFVIDVNDAQVTVVGTSFNIKSTETRTEVIVETGIVDVAKNEKAVRLKPNEKATVLIDRDAPIKENNTDELYNYYKTKVFVCENTPLPRLVEVLNEAFDTEIVIGNERLKHATINTTFTNDLQETLDVLQKQHGIMVSREGNKIVLQ